MQQKVGKLLTYVVYLNYIMDNCQSPVFAVIDDIYLVEDTKYK